MKILISGYYGFGNVGDEAVLESILQGFRRHSPEAEITVLSASPRLTAELNGVRSVHRYDFISILREMKNTDVLVSGGGTLFQDATSTRSFLYYIGMVFLAKLFDRKTVVFAQGFGPLRRKINRWLARMVLNLADLITLRDEDSLRELNGLGVKKPPIFVTADLTALLEMPDKNEGQRILALEGISLDKPLIGVAVRSVPYHPELEENLFQALAGQLDRLSLKHGYRPVFLLFQCPEDMRQASMVISRMKEKSSVIFRICRPKEMLSLFPHFELVIGMRLHSLIFAAMNAVPMLGISYDPKVEAFMRSIGQPCVGVASDMGDILDEILSRKGQIKQDLEEKRKILFERAELNFELLFKILIPTLRSTSTFLLRPSPSKMEKG